MPRDCFAISGCRDEAVYDRCIAEPFAFTVGVRSSRAGFRELREQSLDALKELLRTATAEVSNAALRRLCVSVFNIHRHLSPFQGTLRHRIHAGHSGN